MGESGRQDVTSVELVGGVEKRDLVLVDHDPGWAVTFRDHRARIDAALGGRARRIEHIGSTAVPGLAAKPIIDILVTVDDIVAEEEYLEPLVAMEGPDMNAYADAKTEVITAIKARARRELRD